jgi:hypothetical protein
MAIDVQTIHHYLFPLCLCDEPMDRADSLNPGNFPGHCQNHPGPDRGLPLPAYSLQFPISFSTVPGSVIDAAEKSVSPTYGAREYV